MNARLLRFTLQVAVCPILGVVLILANHDHPTTVNLVLILASLLQLSVLLISKKAMQPFIHPDIDVLTQMGVEYVPAPFEPGRFKTDTKVASVCMWLSLLGPAFMWLALRNYETVTVTVLNFYTYEAPSINLLSLGFVSLLLGILAFPFWVQMARASAMYAEGSDRKRYLMRGFFDRLELYGSVEQYQAIRKGRTGASGTGLHLRRGGAAA